MRSADALAGCVRSARANSVLSCRISSQPCSFSNSGPITVGALFVLVHTLRRTNVVNNLCHKAFGGSTNPRVGMARSVAHLPPPSVIQPPSSPSNSFLIVVNFCSAFLNNTPLVALMYMPPPPPTSTSNSFTLCSPQDAHRSRLGPLSQIPAFQVPPPPLPPSTRHPLCRNARTRLLLLIDGAQIPHSAFVCCDLRWHDDNHRHVHHLARPGLIFFKL